MSNAFSNSAFFQHTTEVNIARAKLCALIAIIIEGFLLIRNFVIYGVSFHYYVLLHLFLITISVILYGSLRIIQRRNDLKNVYCCSSHDFYLSLFDTVMGRNTSAA